MAFRLTFSARALHEMGEAHDWYEMRSPGLGEEFLYSEVITGVRRALLRRFPYGAFSAVRSDLVHVLAVPT